MDLGALRVQVVPKTQTNWYVPPLGYAWGGGGPGVAVWGRVGLSGSPGGAVWLTKKKDPPLLPKELKKFLSWVFLANALGNRGPSPR